MGVQGLVRPVLPEISTKVADHKESEPLSTPQTLRAPTSDRQENADLHPEDQKPKKSETQSKNAEAEKLKAKCLKKEDRKAKKALKKEQRVAKQNKKSKAKDDKQSKECRKEEER